MAHLCGIYAHVRTLHGTSPRLTVRFRLRAHEGTHVFSGTQAQSNTPAVLLAVPSAEFSPGNAGIAWCVYRARNSDNHTWSFILSVARLRKKLHPRIRPFTTDTLTLNILYSLCVWWPAKYVLLGTATTKSMLSRGVSLDAGVG